MLFADELTGYGGLLLEKTRGDSIFSLLSQKVAQGLGQAFRPPLLTIFPDFAEPLSYPSFGKSTLYAGLYQASEAGSFNLVKISDLMRLLDANRDRLAYLKAWQVFLGVGKETIKVIDNSDKKH